jgi:hypothetical protein
MTFFLSRSVSLATAIQSNCTVRLESSSSAKTIARPRTLIKSGSGSGSETMDTSAPNGEKDLIEDGLLLMRSFSKITDPKIRAEIIELVEKRVGEMPPKPGDQPPFELDPRD